MTESCFAPGAKFEPYWWEAAPRPDLPEIALPAKADVAVVGSGYTGLSAALALARAGRSVLVLDAEAAGWGASSRNQGHLGLIKRPFADLERAHGRKLALALIREGQAAIAFTKSFVEKENIACHLKTNGRYIAAATPGHYEALAREVETLKREVGFEADMVPRAEQGREIGSDRYHGGEVRRAEASLHGALFHAGLLERVRAAGVAIAAHTRVLSVEPEAGGLRVATARGALSARNVLVATNGYTRTSRAFPKLRRRVIPIGAYGFATETLAPERLASLIPSGRAIVDTWKLSHSLRPAPDGSRLCGGGRVSMYETDFDAIGPRLRAYMLEVFPALADVRFSHVWMGYVGYTFQFAPHLGVRDGLHYALGFCGYGVALAPYLGWKAAQKILGTAEGRSAYEDLPFRTRPLYDGEPWFLPFTLAWYRHQDRRAARAS